ncbi:MAG: ATP-binding protein [Myxococcales bacterium]|nr:ATP-binding protein [Myxococcales bacterium]
MSKEPAEPTTEPNGSTPNWLDPTGQSSRVLLQLVLDAFPIRVFWKDRELRYLGCNRLFAGDAGFASPAELIGKSDYEMAWREQAELYRADDRAVILSGEAKLNYEEPQSGPDGKRLWLRTNKIPLRAESGEVLGMLGSYEDITDEKDMYLELERHRNELESLVEERTAELKLAHANLLDLSRRAGMAEVATNVLHNVGNVLNSVNVTTQMLRDRNRNQPSQRLLQIAALLESKSAELSQVFAGGGTGGHLPAYMRKLATAAERERDATDHELDKLTSHIDHIKQIVAVQQEYAKVRGVAQQCELEPLLREAIQISQASTNRPEVEFSLQLAALPAILIDRNRALHILVNLISNAIYAYDGTERTQKRVTIMTSPADADRVRIDVSDQGIGIPARNLEKVFRHGFTTRDKGHGYGLHASALAAAELGGSLVASSDGPGRGAAFTLEIPSRAPQISSAPIRLSSRPTQRIKSA